MLKAEFWPLVKSGKKTITIRKRTRLRPGDDVLIHAGGKIVGRARILRVYRKRVDEIGEKEAKKEGIPLEKLREILRELYGSSEVYVIEFQLEEVFDPPIDPHTRRYGEMDPVEIARIALKEGLYEGEKEKGLLELIVREGSLRRAAQRLGGLGKRKILRRLLSRVLERLSASSGPSSSSSSSLSSSSP